MTRQRRAAQAQLLGSPFLPPAVTNRHYLKLLQVWQWEGRTLDEILTLAKATGFTGLLVKALDGPYWMGGIDPSSWALRDVASVSRQAGIARERGLYYFCWTNPRQFEIEAQTTATAGCAMASDGVFLDIEPYAQFWGPWAEIGLASSFMTSLRSKAQNAFIALQPDPRLNALAALRINEWAPQADAISGQHYWSDFHSDPSQELAHARSLGGLYGVPSLPTLPGNAPWSSFPWDEISQSPGFAVWRLGSTPQAILERLGSLTVQGIESDKLEVR